LWGWSPKNQVAEAGWRGWNDWLGNEHRWRSFNKARAFAQRLRLKSGDEWRDYCNSGNKPNDIPNAPQLVYANDGWAGMGDWLGTGFIALRKRKYLPFKKARAFARGLDLKSGNEWRDYSKSGKKPADIPAMPNQTYAESGWAGMGDWLGTGTIATRLRQYRSFKKARGFARALGLKSRSEWADYCKSGNKPDDIPTSPNIAYVNDGWVGVGDWLGNARPE
jgi:hypothetical protein